MPSSGGASASSKVHPMATVAISEKTASSSSTAATSTYCGEVGLAAPPATAMASRTSAYTAASTTPMTYTVIPSARIAAMASIVAASSMHEVGPQMPPGAQQFSEGSHCPSMFG